MNASMARLAHSMSMSFIRVSLIATLKIMMSVRTSVAKRCGSACKKDPVSGVIGV